MKERLKVLIVDDELPVRQELRAFHWEKSDAELVGECEDGETALDFCRENRVDLIISDITMPSMDGISLFSRIREEHPHIQLIVLTCHKNFDYVSQMLRLGVLDYLVKVSMRDEDLERVLRKARAAIEQSCLAQKGSSENRRYSCAKLFAELRSQKPDYPAIQKGLLEQGRELVFPMKPVQLFLHCAGEDINFFGMEIHDILFERDIFDSSILEFVPYSVYRYLVLPTKNYGDAKLISSALYNGVERVNAHIRNEWSLGSGNMFLFAVTGRAVYGLAQLREYLLSTKGWRYRPFYEPDMPILMDDDNFSLAQGRPEQLSLWNEGMELKSRPEELLAFISGPTRQLLQEKHFAPDAVKSFFGHWITELLDIPRGPERQAISFDNLTSLDEVLNKALYLLQTHLQAQTPLHPEIKRALAYISKHLDKQLSLAAVAESVGLSTYYLSRLFHTEVGVPFNDYVTGKRVNHAAYLLKNSNMKVYEIACEVGIPNYRYFSMIFKKRLGVTPMEYKKQ